LGCYSLFLKGVDMATKDSGKMSPVKTAAPSRDGLAERGKTKGKVIAMSGSSNGLAKGGKVAKKK